MVGFFDTHCHIQEADGTNADDLVQGKWLKLGLTSSQLVTQAQNEGLDGLIVVGCTAEDSKRAIDLANKHHNVWASVGIHPHESATALEDGSMSRMSKLVKKSKVVAIGECGLDYFYNNSPKDAQEQILHKQLQLASLHNLPVIFHVRQAYEDFWPIFDQYNGLKGVLHSFTDSMAVLEQALTRGLYIGLNGIMTFTKDNNQLEMAKAVPQDRLLLETDAPFLTPRPFRDTVCRPQHIVLTAEFLANLRGESLEELITATNANAKVLFSNILG